MENRDSAKHFNIFHELCLAMAAMSGVDPWRYDISVISKYLHVYFAVVIICVMNLDFGTTSDRRDRKTGQGRARKSPKK